MSIFPRGKKGIYYYEFEIKGHRYCKATGTTDRNQALKIEQTERERIRKELNAKPVIAKEPRKQLMLSKAIDMCYDERWKDNKDGVRTYQLANRIISLIGDKALNEITNDDITDMVQKLENSGLKNGTINRYQAALKTILYLALRKWKVISYNDFPYIRTKREPPPRQRIISDREIKRLITLFSQMDEDEMGDIVVILANTGLRLNELLELPYDNIDFESSSILITKSKTDIPRQVPMITRVKSILERRKADGNLLKPFILKDHQVHKRWNKAREIMGLSGDKEFVPHSLRHTFASRLAKNKVDLLTISRLLGHKSIKTTERYIHLLLDQLKQTVDLLEDNDE